MKFEFVAYMKLRKQSVFQGLYMHRRAHDQPKSRLKVDMGRKLTRYTNAFVGLGNLILLRN